MPHYQCIAGTLDQMTLTQIVVDYSHSWGLEPSTSPSEVSGTCPFSSSSRNSLRSVDRSASIFIENPVHVNAAASQKSEGVEEQHQSVHTGLGVQIAFMKNLGKNLNYWTQRLHKVIRCSSSRNISCAGHKIRATLLPLG